MTPPDTLTLGKYTVRVAVRLDNPAFPRYIIMRASKVVGCSFSCPDEDQCEAIERFVACGRYVETSAPIKHYSYRLQKKRKA